MGAAGGRGTQPGATRERRPAAVRRPAAAPDRRRLAVGGTLGGVQGVIKSYDPVTGDGVVVNEADLADIDLADDALEGSLFRMLRQGQRVQFDLDEAGRATRLRLGSEVDMGTPRL